MVTRRRDAIWPALALVVAAACGGPEPESEGAVSSHGPPEQEAPAGAGGGTVHEFAYVVPHVEHLIGFLRGEETLRPGALADSVTLYVAPEGGGEAVTVPAAALDDPAAWRVGGHDLVPPADYRERTTSPGLHWNCRPTGLDTRYPELAGSPHAGVKLEPEGASSCLQTWNATFVFDGNAERPRLMAVVYDQWEW